MGRTPSDQQVDRLVARPQNLSSRLAAPREECRSLLNDLDVIRHASLHRRGGANNLESATSSESTANGPRMTSPRPAKSAAWTQCPLLCNLDAGQALNVRRQTFPAADADLTGDPFILLTRKNVLIQSLRGGSASPSM